ncbi:hypothetical protein GETHPA_08770 [Geothrix rubra]|uniref:Copper chaperone PCu(A)C n=1 Tax=Geothrix rubra TaxID=2927977 RepID=A0ABQ5Q4R1_9BACT|nr:hypothetical protein [Geothrix rubra]GLH69344.1 hypothetical protein GETHPA_08770 [Geothrix rubra]
MKTAALLAILVLPLAAQTRMDRAHPLPLPSDGVITGRIAEDDRGEAYYAFTAGPGPLVVTVDITPSDANINVDLGLSDQAGHAKLAMNPRAYNDKSVRETKRIVLPRAEHLVMRVGRNHYGGSGTFRIRVEGAVNGGAESLDLPARGTLRLTLKDGRTVEVDLATVRDAKVLPPR